MEKNLLSAVATTIKNLRQESHLSQEELAHLSQLDRTYISGIEREVGNPSIKSIQKIIDALKISNLEFTQKLEGQWNEK